MTTGDTSEAAIILTAKAQPSRASANGSGPASNREYDWVDDPQDQFFRYLVAPTVKRMQSIDVRKLTIEIRNGKILFEMLPAEGASDVRQPEQNSDVSGASDASAPRNG